MSNKKPNIEVRKELAAKRLSARTESLKTKGMSAGQIDRDPKVKQLKADVRKANMQLTNIAKNEKQIARMAETKAEKLAAPKTDRPKQKKAGEAPAKKKSKKPKKADAGAAAG